MVPLGRVNGMSFDNGRIQLAQGGLGKAQFGVQTQHLIDQADNIGLVVCAGIAGSLVSSVSVGDVVVATATIEHDFN